MYRYLLSHRKGFSLMELMLVVSLMGILTTLALPSYKHYTKRVRFTEIITAVEPFKTAITLALQEGIPKQDLMPGSHGLPEAPSPSAYLQSISIEQGTITAISTARLDQATYRLIPNEDGSAWTVSGTCVQKGFCHE